jgi:2-keto-3-deoxy-L-rhamnonate aldolase RhmA
MIQIIPSCPAKHQTKVANDLLLTVIRIEWREAQEDIEAIAATPGVYNLLFVGPLDLTTSL